MKQLRFVLAAVVVLTLGVGYFASQRAYFTGQAAEYAARVDQTPLVLLSLLLFLGCIVAWLLPNKERAEEES